MPITIITGAISTVITGTIFQTAVILFWLVAITKFINEILAYTINRAAWQVLYEPLPANQRLRTQTVVESMVKPTAGGLTGIILLAFNRFFAFGTVQIAYILIVVIPVWIGVIFLLNRAYLETLLQALTRRRFQTASPFIADSSSLAALKKGLKSSHPGVVVYSLNLLEEFEPGSLPTFFESLLEHPEAKIRLEALARIERWNITSAVPAIRRRLYHETDDTVWGASLRTLAILGGSQIFEEISAYLESPNPRIKVGAMVGLLRNVELGETYTNIIRQTLSEFAESADSTKRSFAAQVIGEAGVENFDYMLLKLLRDNKMQVRQQALIATRKLKYHKLWPAVIENLDIPKVRASAMVALVAGGSEVIPELRKAFIKMRQKRNVLIRLIQLCGRIGSDQTTKILLEQLFIDDEQIRHQVLLALNQSSYQAEGEAIVFVQQKIRVEAAWATWIIASLVDLGRQDNSVYLLQTALENNLARHRMRLLLWLSFIYDPQWVRKVQVALELATSTDGQLIARGAYALEIIDVLVSSDMKGILFPLLDNSLSPEQCLHHLRNDFPQETLTHQQRLQAIIIGKSISVDPWTKACALYTVAQLNIIELSEIVALALFAPHPMVRETAVWTIFKLDRELFKKRVNELMQDPDPHVVRVVEWLDAESGEHKIMLSLIEKVIFLKAVSIFSETPEDILAELASILTELQAKPGETILEKGETGSSLYIIVDGQVQVHDGEQNIGILEIGDVFGELALLDTGPRSASVTILKNARLLRLDQDVFYELMADRVEVAKGIIRVLVQRLRTLNQKFTSH
jgi:HEAT repeat protein